MTTQQQLINILELLLLLLLHIYYKFHSYSINRTIGYGNQMYCCFWCTKKIYMFCCVTDSNIYLSGFYLVSSQVRIREFESQKHQQNESVWILTPRAHFPPFLSSVRRPENVRRHCSENSLDRIPRQVTLAGRFYFLLCSGSWR